MKTLIGLNIFMRLGLNFLECWLTNTISLENPFTLAVSLLVAPDISGGSNPLSAAWTLIPGLSTYINGFFKIVLMYEPTVFAGDRVYLWWFGIAPLAVITALVIVFSILAK